MFFLEGRWCGAVRCGAAWRGVRCGAVRCSVCLNTLVVQLQVVLDATTHTQQMCALGYIQPHHHITLCGKLCTCCQ